MIRVPASALATPGFELRRLGMGRFRLRLWGGLAPGAVASLADALADAGIRLVRGFARRSATLRAMAEFELEQSGDARDPLGLDVLAIVARDPPAHVGRLPALEVERLALSPKHGGSIELELAAPDGLRVLGSLLTSIAALALFPEELHLDTRESRLRLRLFLVGVGRSAPDASLVAALGQRLRGE